MDYMTLSKEKNIQDSPEYSRNEIGIRGSACTSARSMSKCGSFYADIKVLIVFFVVAPDLYV